MSEIGYYRFKFEDLKEGTHTVEFYQTGSLVVTHTIEVKPFCENQKLVKYLDHDGQYRFHPFNVYWQGSDSPNLLGKSNRLITSILTGQTNTKNIGYKNSRKISLVADDVNSDELEILSDIYTSPRVYLHVGKDNNDSEEDWIQVDISGDNIYKRRKNLSGNVKIECTLPEWFSIGML